MENLNQIIVTVNDLSDLFDVDIRTVQRYVVEGMPRLDHGKYNLYECIVWQYKKLKAIIEELESGDAKLSILKKEEQKLKNEMRRVSLSKMQNKVVDLELIRMAWLRQLNIFSSNIDAMAPRINNKLNGDREQFAKIKEETDQTRDMIAEQTKLDFDNKELNELDQPIKEEEDEQ